MERNQLFIGMRVFLSLDCEYTRKYYGWSLNMDKYQGNFHKIESISMWDGNHRAKLHGTGDYNWSIKDLSFGDGTTLKIDKNLKPVHFDVKELVL